MKMYPRSPYLYSKVIGIIIYLSTCVLPVYGQNTILIKEVKAKNNTLSFDIAGVSLNILGISYDRILYRYKTLGIYGSMGFSVLPIKLEANSYDRVFTCYVGTGVAWSTYRNKILLGATFTYRYDAPEFFVRYPPKYHLSTDMQTIFFKLAYRRFSKKENWYYGAALTPFLFLDRHDPMDLYDNDFFNWNFGLNVGIQF
jgi:hypothetical protein